jgi:hypothetical protein
MYGSKSFKKKIWCWGQNPGSHMLGKCSATEVHPSPKKDSVLIVDQCK